MKRLIPLFLCIFFVSFLLHSQTECKITYIANEGFLIETGSQKIITDALFDNIDGNWCDSPSDSIVDLMKKALPPFNDIDLITISHKHQDHFNEGVVVQFLINNPGAKVICPKQVEFVLAQNPNYGKFKKNIIAITPDLYCDSITAVSGISIRILRLEHSHYMEEDTIHGGQINRHRDIENLGFVFNVEGIKFFHCGDTNPLNEKEYASFKLKDAEIDIAFLERLFFSKGAESIAILNKYIDPKEMILMHINPANQELFSNHFKEVENIKVFERKMDSIGYKM
ncbi:MAG: MBL fold metallo-hydrolase [Bacteroidales bacterium]|nr:MBL fold metallo-hydrolase [Bacteroidales bacterium]MCF8458035.1 MBL fold metallo-hydrolase [Bacteroidales bacterium]